MNKKLVMVSLVVVALALIAFGTVNAFLSTEPAPAIPVTVVERVFIDIDGDGHVDLLVFGEVIMNSAGGPDFLAPTPNPYPDQ